MYSPAYPKQDNDSDFPWAGAGATAVGLGALAATPLGLRSALGFAHGVKALPGGGLPGGIIERAAVGANNLGSNGRELVSEVGNAARNGVNAADAHLIKRVRDRLDNSMQELRKVLNNPEQRGLRPADVIRKELSAGLNHKLLTPEEKLAKAVELRDMMSQWHSGLPAKTRKRTPLDFKELDALIAKHTPQQGSLGLRDSLP